MSTLPETSVAKSWDDPALNGAILKKGERKPTTKPAKSKPVTTKQPLLDTHCGLPVRDCKCSIWERGLPAPEIDMGGFWG